MQRVSNTSGMRRSSPHVKTALAPVSCSIGKSCIFPLLKCCCAMCICLTEGVAFSCHEWLTLPILRCNLEWKYCSKYYINLRKCGM